MFATQEQLASTNLFPTSPITTEATVHQRLHDPTIVGPSDHYGTHQAYISSPNNINIANNDAIEQIPSTSRQAPASKVDETKICVIVDSRTPVIFKIPLPANRITLRDFKSALPALNQPNYKYFFKSSDSEFGIVKEEIQEDESILPTYRNRVVAWIVTPGRVGDELASKSGIDTCNLTYTNTSYDDCSSSVLTTDIDTNSYFTETDEDSISCSNYSETTCDTFISQRRNKHHNERPPVHHHNSQHRSMTRHESSTSSPYRYLGYQHDQHQSHQIIDDLSRSSSTSSSASSASYSDATAVQCITVHLVLTNENFLGLHIYANAIDGVDEGIYVDGVTENSAVAIDGRIEPGDKLIQVNEVNLEELSNEGAVKVLKDAVIKRGPLKLVVAKFVESNRNDPVDSIVDPKEAIHPIDTAAWVAHAQAITIPNLHHEHANSATSSPSFGSNAQDTDCIRPASAGLSRLNTGLRLNCGTTDMKEIIHHMKMPEIGLEIKDREWLKIHIHNAFLGSDLITWLERNVYGFNNNRDVKKFAIKMLKEAYIRDPISKKSFSSKSYYTFTT